MPARKKSPFKILEASVVKSCTDLLKIKRIIHWRNNVLNGEFRGAGETFWRHVVNGIKGLADWAFLLNDGSGRTVYLEIKKPGGVQSQNQKDFQADCDRRNVPYYCIDNVNDLIEILEIYGM
jgi:hypothetical protein